MIKYVFSIFFIVLTLISFAKAQELKDYYIKFDTRYDRHTNNEGNNRLQGAIRLGFTVDVYKGIELVGMMSTGSKYQSRWSTIDDFNSPEQDIGVPDIFFRQLYLQKRWDDFKIQFGAIPPIKNVASSTGLEPGGWVDGLRMELKTKKGVIEVVAGSIKGLKDPNLFTRAKGFNYFEIELSQEVFDNLIVELSSEYLDGKSYARGEVRYDLELFTDRVIEMVVEGLYNMTDKTHAFQASLNFDLLHLLTGRHRNRIKLSVYYSYIDPNIGMRGELSGDFHHHGHNVVVELGGNIDKKGNVKWFMRNQFINKRFVIGVKFKIGRKK